MLNTPAENYSVYVSSQRFESVMRRFEVPMWLADLCIFSIKSYKNGCMCADNNAAHYIMSAMLAPPGTAKWKRFK